MLEENVEIVRREIEAWNRRDLRAALALWGFDAELDWSHSEGPFKGVYRGHDGLRTWLNEYWSTFGEVIVETHGMTQAGSDVVVPNTAHLRGRDGIQVVARATFVFTVANGKIGRFRMFQEGAEALEARGAATHPYALKTQFQPGEDAKVVDP